MTSTEYPDGFDVLWLASDRDRRIGAFFSAGFGPIPVKALAFVHSPQDAEDQLYKLPASTAATLFVTVPKPEAYLDLAVRGLFMYDWNDVHRTRAATINAYEAVAQPTEPISIDEMPDLLRDLLVPLDVSFESTPLLDVPHHTACVYPRLRQ